MRRIQFRVRLATTFVFLSLSLAAVGWTAQPSDTLLPNTTTGFFSVPDVEALSNHWNRTQLGQLVADPKMKPFIDDFRAQMRHKLAQSGARLGITWQDLEGVPGGEVAMALIRQPAKAPKKDKAVSAILVDITGHHAQAGRLLKKVTANLKAKGAKVSTKNINSTVVTVYDLPKNALRSRASRAFYAIKEDMLLVTDDETEMAGMLRRFGGGASDSLQLVEAYIHVRGRASEKATELVPQVAWFVAPFSFVETLRLANPQERRGTDMLKIFARQGFTAIKGAGGFVNFSANRFEFLHRTAIYAPAVAGAAKGDKYELAARILDFPNSNDFEPPAWVPREIATYLRFNLNTKKAFSAIGSLINEVAHDPTFFEDLLNNLKNDADGPQVDIEKEVVALLADQKSGKGQVVVVTDYQLPITPKSERVLVAVKTSDSTRLAKTIDRVLQSDPTATRRKFMGHVIWEIAAEEDELPLPMVQIGPPLPGAGPRPKVGPAPKAVRMPNAAITVAHGYVMRATHIDFLKKVLASADSAKNLADAIDYQMVIAEMNSLGADKNSFRYFSRTDEELRPTYELIKSGKMPIADTILGRMLNRMFDNGKEDIPRIQQIDGTKLPKYSVVRRHLGPGGTFVTTKSDGWLLVGFMLSKQQQPLAVGMVPVRDDKKEK